MERNRIMGKTKELAAEDNQGLPAVQTPKQSIYNISSEYFDLMREIEDNEGEITPEIAAALEINKDQLEVKASSYAYLMKQLATDQTQIDAEIKRLTAISESKKNTAEKLKERIAQAMLAFNVKNITKNNITLSFRKSSQLVVADDAKTPKQFISTKIVQTVDKKAIKEALESGKKIKGFSILTKENLQIK